MPLRISAARGRARAWVLADFPPLPAIPASSRLKAAGRRRPWSRFPSSGRGARGSVAGGGMRILHVSDLHLGRALGDLSREPEQRALINEIIEVADANDVALTLIAGDVFDAFTPPAWAEELFFELIDGL